jgi:hypothetical protein
MLAPQVHAAKWRKIEKNMPPVRWRVADPSTINLADRGTTNSLAVAVRAASATTSSTARARTRTASRCWANLIADGRFVVTENCPLTYEAIKQYQWEDLSAAARAKGADAPERPLKKRMTTSSTARSTSARAGPAADGIAAAERRADHRPSASRARSSRPSAATSPARATLALVTLA